MHQLAGKKASRLVTAAYATAAAFILYFVFATQAISGATCYANYAVFDTAGGGASLLYGLYYYGWMLVAIGLGIAWSRDKKLPHRSAMMALIAGYLLFIVPTTTVNIIDPATIAGIPSIMCGFAVMLAFVLALKVAPESIHRRNSRSLSLFRAQH